MSTRFKLNLRFHRQYGEADMKRTLKELRLAETLRVTELASLVNDGVVANEGKAVIASGVCKKCPPDPRDK